MISAILSALVVATSQSGEVRDPVVPWNTFAPIRYFDLNLMGGQLGFHKFYALSLGSGANYVAVIAGSPYGTPMGQFFVVDVLSANLLAGPRTPGLEGGNYTHLAKSTDGKLLALAGKDGEVRLISTQTWTRVRSVGFRGEVAGLGFAKGNSVIVTKLVSGATHSYSVADGRPAEATALPASTPRRELTAGQRKAIDGGTLFDMTTDGRFGVCDGPDSFRVLDFAQIKNLTYQPNHNPERVTSADGKFYAIVLDDSSIEVGSIGDPKRKYQCFGHSTRPRCFFSADGKFLYSVSRLFIKKWDSSTGALVADRRLTEQEQFESPRPIGISGDNSTLFIRDLRMTNEDVFGFRTSDLSTTSTYFNEPEQSVLEEYAYNEHVQVVYGTSDLVTRGRYRMFAR